MYGGAALGYEKVHFQWGLLGPLCTVVLADPMVCPCCLAGTRPSLLGGTMEENGEWRIGYL